MGCLRPSAPAERLSSSLSPEVPQGGYAISPKDVATINEDKDTEYVTRLGGPTALVKALASSQSEGLRSDPTLLAQRKQHFGTNRLPEVPPKWFIVIWWGTLEDTLIRILIFGATVSTILGAAIPEQRAERTWSEGLGIWFAVGVVTLVTAVNDWNKDRQFQSLNKQNRFVDVRVVRDGREQMLSSAEVLVGDVLCIETGDKLVADGYLLVGHDMVIDESSLTGESEPIKKHEEEPWCRSGTKVTEGSARMLVTATGLDSEWGKTLALVVCESPDTPLQEKLSDLAGSIGKIGAVVALVTFIVLLVRWCIYYQGFPLREFDSGPLKFFLYAVTIVVVAVPEGLPLAVTISLGYSMSKMIKDKCFVKVLAACETMGGATAICTDKTGTLTENRMTVVEGWFAGRAFDNVPAVEALPPAVLHDLAVGVALNSRAFLMLKPNGTLDFAGSRTECALLVMLRAWQQDYEHLRREKEGRVVKVYGFSSARKMSSVLLSTESGCVLYNKGAPEYVVAACSHVVDATGAVVPMTDDARVALLAHQTAMASRGLRTLALASRQFAVNPHGDPQFDQPPERDMTLVAIVGVKDPVRKEVPLAVKMCCDAGITVRMVTGDNVHTAKHIARECGILSDDGVVLEGPVFRDIPEDEIIALLPRLQVLARSSPKDKHTLVSLLKQRGEVVAVTGDGTNDAPALKEADVGLAMGIAGTEVAKEAADIIILDDNFMSIVKAVLWGRNTFNNIRKFLQFQLTVNFASLILVFIGTITVGNFPLKVLQLLWVNLVMDAFGSLALATESPSLDLLQEKPHGRDAHLLTRAMAKHIVLQGFYQLAWMFLILYGAPRYLDRYRDPNVCHYYSNPANSGLGISACCQEGLNCLQSQGGMYLPGEPPICTAAVFNSTDCDIGRPKRGRFCSQSAPDCQRYDLVYGMYERMRDRWRKALTEARVDIDSIIFNTFIFCQIFNMFNARKIKDELFIYSGLHKSLLFWVMTACMVAGQLLIVFFLGEFFLTRRQTWQEWVFAVGVGAGCQLWSLIIRLATRAVRSVARMMGPLYLRRGSQIEAMQPMLAPVAVVKVVPSDATSAKKA